MKLHLFSLLMIIALFGVSLPVIAENLNSTNYTLINPELSSTSGSTSSENYRALLQVSSGISYGQLSSSLYKMGSGQGYTFMANVPKVACFETNTTSITTECTGLPNGNGMIGECGEEGCYDRAMIQIDSQANPSDTLYSIQVSKDDWETVSVVDGTTHTLKAYSNKSITDYKTKNQWENDPWHKYNLLGLQQNTQYEVRVTALQGDFTETPPSPSKSATTALRTVSFDLDIGSDLTAESDPPYISNLGSLSPETASFPSSQKVKIEVSTNVQSGLSVYVQDTYSGLRSTSTSYTIQSSSEDLANPSSNDGFGLQETGHTEDSNSLGFIVPGSTYDLSGSFVGAVTSSSQTRVFCTLIAANGTCGTTTPVWVTGGKLLLAIGARASLESPAVADFEDQLSFTVTSGL